LEKEKKTADIPLFEVWRGEREKKKQRKTKRKKLYCLLFSLSSRFPFYREEREREESDGHLY